MQKNILIPKRTYEIPENAPVFFLAGPVRGGDDWQKTCAELIVARLSEARIAIPYYHASDVRFPLRESALHGTGSEFERQLNWERHYMELASQRGCLIFWLPEESKINPRQDGLYACDTRGEIGEWRGRLMGNRSLKVVVGGEEGFYSFSQIRRNFTLALGNDFPIYPTLIDTVNAAVSKAK